MNNLQENIKNRTIFCRDNIDVLRGINSGSIDLVYLDPPFNKNKNFTAPIGSSAEGAEFKDWFREEDVKGEWLQTIKEDYDGLYKFLSNIKELSNITNHQKNKHYLYNYCYLCYMAIRLIEIQRILKDTGSIYLHCDPTMSHYLKILMDILFGEKNFRNEIVWQRNDGRGKGSQFENKKFGSNNDIIFFYTKTNDFFLNNTLELTDQEVAIKFNKEDEKGEKYYTGIPIFRSKSMGSRPNLCYEWKGFKNPYPSGWRLSKERLEEEYQKGNIVIKNNKLERRKYLKDYQGSPLDSNWTDIPRVIKGTGYPTQKPLPLLERIIKASTNKGDTVLDPFCGCATTCVAAEKLNRKWFGIDVSQKAYELVKQRLINEVANPEDLFQYDKEVFFTTTPPQKTDENPDSSLKKYIYIISNPKYEREYKVGIAKDYKSRLNTYQTSDPDRNYKIEYVKHTTYFREIEKYIHSKFENKHEWVRADLQKIIEEIENYKE